MKVLYRDIAAATAAVVGGVAMFAKLNSYSWWLIGSWKGAIGVLAVLGLAIMLTNIVEIFREADAPALGELFAWLFAGTVAVASLFATTSTKLEFIWTGVVIGVAWLLQTTRHAWRAGHHKPSQFVHA